MLVVWGSHLALHSLWPPDLRAFRGRGAAACKCRRIGGSSLPNRYQSAGRREPDLGCSVRIHVCAARLRWQNLASINVLRHRTDRATGLVNCRATNQAVAAVAAFLLPGVDSHRRRTLLPGPVPPQGANCYYWAPSKLVSLTAIHLG